jgi:chromosome segregation ATPase
VTIDERLDRLTERHEALTQSVELLAIASQRTDEQIRALGEKIDALTVRVDLLTAASSALVRVMESHERRLTDLEGGK